MTIRLCTAFPSAFPTDKTPSRFRRSSIVADEEEAAALLKVEAAKAKGRLAEGSAFTKPAPVVGGMAEAGGNRTHRSGDQPGAGRL
jgi:hypothetical protein